MEKRPVLDTFTKGPFFANKTISLLKIHMFDLKVNFDDLFLIFTGLREGRSSQGRAAVARRPDSGGDERRLAQRDPLARAARPPADAQPGQAGHSPRRRRDLRDAGSRAPQEERQGSWTLHRRKEVWAWSLYLRGIFVLLLIFFFQ